jgi:porphobilinogen synthase
MTGTFPSTRLRRLRYKSKIRDLVRETQLDINDFLLPIFIRHGKGENRPIASMPGLYQITLENLHAEIDEIVKLGIPGVLLFGIPEFKDATGSDAYHSEGIIPRAIRTIKKHAPDLLVISDLCCCEYTDHGHCGAIDNSHGDNQHGAMDVNNDVTLKILQEQAVTHAQAGTDIIAPSGMIDGMVQAIRQALDQHNFYHIPITSYAVKYASGLYGPFREAAEGAPKFGDRRSYQMDPANGNEALREAEQDVAEGADMLMVKPASLYLDVIYRVKQQFPSIPMSAYHVSGEFAMIKAAAANGWIDEKRVVLESMLSLKRAGADFIFTYFAKDLARWLKM